MAGQFVAGRLEEAIAGSGGCGVSVYDFSAETGAGGTRALRDYEGRVLLIVNTASRCGFTPQYQGLQRLYDAYRGRGFEILAFPCNQFAHQEPGTDDEIQQFCQVQYGVSFPLFAKVDVNGPNAHPLYRHLTAQKRGLLGSGAIKWNFTKFLVDRTGLVVKRYAPPVAPAAIAPAIERLLP